MLETKFIVLDASIRIMDLEIPRKDVADFFRDVREEERQSTFIRALEVGIFCLERTRTSQDTEFVRHQVESLLRDVEKAVVKIPDETQKALIAKIGTSEGQILAPVQNLINEVSCSTADRLREVRDLLSQEIDPSRETTTLGKVLKNLRDLLDPKRTDSIQGSLEIAIKSVTTEDGALARAVKTVVADAVKPLAEEVDRLAKEVRGQEAVAEALKKTTGKGATYEDEVVELLQKWSQVAGAEINYVGPDNRPRDVLVKFVQTSLSSIPVTIVLEVRDRQAPLGRKVISDVLKEAMAERHASAAIYLSRSSDGLAREIGEWAEGESERGPFIACTHEHVITALRFLIVQERLANLRAATSKVDLTSIEGQLNRVRTALDRIKTINRKVTEVCGSAENIRTEADSLRDDIRSALTNIEDAMHIVSDQAQAISAS